MFRKSLYICTTYSLGLDRTVRARSVSSVSEGTGALVQRQHLYSALVVSLPAAARCISAGGGRFDRSFPGAAAAEPRCPCRTFFSHACKAA